ncbi:hypothetical protein ACFLZP_02520 [Patescibacteria group bacterium]
MKKTYLLADGALAYLLRIALGFQKPIEGKVHSITPKESSLNYIKTQASLAMLASIEGQNRLFTLKTTLGLQTITRLKEQAKILKRKAYALHTIQETTNATVSIALLLNDAEQLSKYADSLSNYKKDEGLKLEDINQISKFPNVNRTLLDHLIVTQKQIPDLKKYVESYLLKYKKRLIEGQERLPLPEVLANPILRLINADSFVKTYGLKRVVVSGMSFNYFCHSLLYLHYENKIRLLDLRKWPHQDKNNLIYEWEAVLNNKTVWDLSAIGPNDEKAGNKAYSTFIKKKFTKKRLDNTNQEINWIRWDGLELNIKNGRCQYKGNTHTLKTKKPQFIILKSLIKRRGKQISYQSFLKKLSAYLPYDSEKKNKGWLRLKVRGIRRVLGINSKKNPEDDLFHWTGTGCQLILPKHS